MKTKNSSVIFDSDYVGHYCLFVQNRICTLDVMFLVRNTPTPEKDKFFVCFCLVVCFSTESLSNAGRLQCSTTKT